MSFQEALQQGFTALGGGALAAIVITMVRARSQDFGTRATRDIALLDRAIKRIETLEALLGAEQEARRKDRDACDAEVSAMREQIRTLERQMFQINPTFGGAHLGLIEPRDAEIESQLRRLDAGER